MPFSRHGSGVHMPRLRPGLARVEYFAVREEVLTLLAEGHTYASAYDALKDKGKITMCYGAFRSYANGSRNSTKNDAEEKKWADDTDSAKHTTQADQFSSSKNIKIPEEKFEKRNIPDPSELM